MVLVPDGHVNKDIIQLIWRGYYYIALVVGGWRCSSSYCPPSPADLPPMTIQLVVDDVLVGTRTSILILFGD